MDLATHDRKIFSTFDRIKEREHERASEAGEDRQEIGQLLELTGLNKKAVSMVRSLDKMPEDKRNDCLRSFKALLARYEKRWDGGQIDWVDQAVQPASPQEFERETQALSNITPFVAA